MKGPLDSAEEILVVRQRPRFRGSMILLRLADKVPFGFIKRRAYQILLVPVQSEDLPDG